jgi:hypothetical protein
MADRCLPSATKQKVGIFCLPGFVEDHRQIYFSHGSLLRFFFHVHNPFAPNGVNVFCPTY